MKDILNILRKQADNLSVLYAEDNAGLRLQMHKFLRKFFKKLYVAKDGLDGLELYKQYQPRIVITDIKMPNMDGLEMSKKIKDMNPDVKIIIISAFDDKEKLYEAIDIGTYRYEKKPLDIKDFIKVLLRCANDITKEEQRETFNKYIKDIFHYQDNMLVLMENGEPVVANSLFLDFFGVENIEELKKKYKDIGDRFYRVDTFLYNENGINWLSKIKQNPDSLFNIKTRSKKGQYVHLILKAKIIPESKNQMILSFSDVTQLGLLSIFEKNENSPKDVPQKNLSTLLKSIKDNNATVKLLNFYKGLTITNESKIIEASKDRIVFKTTYLQQKAIKLEKSVVLVSDFLPKDMLCMDVEYIDFENRTVSLLKYKMLERSPRDRMFVRVIPENNHEAKIFHNARAFETKIVDISVKAAKFEIEALPAKITVNSRVILSAIFFMNSKPVYVKRSGSVLRIDEMKDRYHIVLFFEDEENEEKKLKEYVANRQIALIREFKNI